MTEPTEPQRENLSDDQGLIAQFERIRRQPEAAQRLMLSRLICASRFPKEQVMDLYSTYCSQRDRKASLADPSLHRSPNVLDP